MSLKELQLLTVKVWDDAGVLNNHFVFSFVHVSKRKSFCLSPHTL